MQHTLNSKKGWYETAAQNAGYKAGHSVILEAEDHTVLHKKNTEGLWDSQKFEIAGAENGSSGNIRNALKHCAAKPDCEVAVIFVLEDMGNANLRVGLARYNGLKGSSQWKEFKEIYVVDINGDIKHLPPAGND